MTPQNANSPRDSRTPAIVILLAWLVVAVPAGWGIEQTALKSKALFSRRVAPAATPAPPTGSASAGPFMVKGSSAPRYPESTTAPIMP